MEKRNHKELWEQLKVLITYGKQQRYGKKEIIDLMGLLEIGQLAQDPLAEILSIRKEE